MVRITNFMGHFTPCMSAFNVHQQDLQLESKIVVALERISEAFRVLLWNESKDKSLSPIQIQILIFLLFHTAEKCTVSYLAEEFNMTKATISDSVKVLLQKGLIMKMQNITDTRSYSMALSAEGKEVAQKASLFASAFEKPLAQLSDMQKETLLATLLKVIHDLNRAGIITVQRMCFTCSYYKADKGTHFCQLVQAPLLEQELKIDCPDHKGMQ